MANRSSQRTCRSEAAYPWRRLAIAARRAEAIKDAPAVYAKYFTALELRAISAFYRTSVGAKVLQTMPKVMIEHSTGVRPKVGDFQQGVRTKCARNPAKARPPELGGS
jgi:hypothetical protein